MVGKKGRSGRPIKWKNNPFAERNRKNALKYYYKNREERLARMREYHKKNVDIMKFAKKHGLSIPEARKRLKEQKRKERSK